MSEATTTAASGEQGSPATSTPGESGSTGQAETNWYDGFGEDTKNLAINKQWDGPEAAVRDAMNLEKLMGVPADRIVKLPGEGATPEEQMEVWDKLGRPGDPNGYELPTGEAVDENFQSWARDTFHKIGLPAEMGKRLAEAYNEMVVGMETQAGEARQAKAEAEAKALTSEWGAAYDQNVNQARMAAKGLGVDGETVDRLEQAMGFAGTMKFFHNISAKMGEGDFVTSASAGTGSILTPQAAQARISALRRDPGFVKRYTAGDATARDEMARLHEQAYPDVS